MSTTASTLCLAFLLVTSAQLGQPVSVERAGPNDRRMLAKRYADEKALARAVHLRYSEALGLSARVSDSVWSASPGSRVIVETGEYEVAIARPDSLLIRWIVVDAKGSHDTGEVSFLAGKGHVTTSRGKSDVISSLDDAIELAVGWLDNSAVMLPELFFGASDRRRSDLFSDDLVFGPDRLVNGEPCYTLVSRSPDNDGVQVEMSISIERLLVVRMDGQAQRDDGSVTEYVWSFTYSEFREASNGARSAWGSSSPDYS